MNDLIEALTILAKYVSHVNPTCCEHDVLYVLVNPAQVTAADRDRLSVLGFLADASEHHFYSHRFGSA